MNNEEQKAKHAEYMREYRKKNKEEFNRKKREYMKEYRKKNKEKMRKYFKEYKKRTHCQKRYDAEHPEWQIMHRYRQRIKKHIDKITVINHYGGKCALCGITDIDMLTIDHEFNDGNKDREGRTSRFYTEVVKDGFPENKGYRVLCYNHNYSIKIKRDKEFHDEKYKKLLAKYGKEDEFIRVSSLKDNLGALKE